MLHKLHDFSELEQRLRETVAPVIEFLEKAVEVDNGWPDRFEGERKGKFNPDDFALDFAFANPLKRVGFTLDHSVEFSHYNEHGHGPFLELSVWMRDHSYHAKSAEMAIIIHGDDTLLYQGACHLLKNPPSRDVVPISHARHGFYGVYGILDIITDTYAHICGKSDRIESLERLATEVRHKHIMAEDIRHPDGYIAPPRLNGH